MKMLNLLKNRYLSKYPFFLVLFVTSRCNARCKMCFNWKNISERKSRKELSLDELERVSKSIGSLQQLTISGGEPFLREDLAEICTAFNRNSHVQFITIPTNGLLPERIEKTVINVLDRNPDVHFRIGLSLPDIGNELDEIFGVKDSFARHRETYERLSRIRQRYENFNIDAAIVCNRYNIDRLKIICEYVVESMEGCNPIVSMVRGSPRIPSAKDIDVEDQERIYTYCMQSIPETDNRPFAGMMNLMREMVYKISQQTVRRQRRVIPCVCGRKLVVIYDNGDVYPCELLDDRMGNLRQSDYDLASLLRTKESRDIVNKIARSKCFCTWECAINNNIIFSGKFTAELLSRYFLKKSERLWR